MKKIKITRLAFLQLYKKRVVSKETFRNSYPHIDDVHLLNVILAFVFDFFLQILQILQL